ncbi:hypothetical protein M5K25_003365 [Dendrobium thyrsiflorum]|uniref:Uncharacterized protein n=1 Tax=Dendrobium thyrsiflorum TaxID=117978 RepID=A0ABD0VKF0_DENTH
MQSLQEKASVWSGVAASDAFAIDETNVFNVLGGDIKPFVDLSTNFYNRVYDDEEEWFRSIFAGSRKEDAIRNQTTRTTRKSTICGGLYGGMLFVENVEGFVMKNFAENFGWNLRRICVGKAAANLRPPFSPQICRKLSYLIVCIRFICSFIRLRSSVLSSFLFTLRLRLHRRLLGSSLLWLFVAF